MMLDGSRRPSWPRRKLARYGWHRALGVALKPRMVLARVFSVSPIIASATLFVASAAAPGDRTVFDLQDQYELAEDRLVTVGLRAPRISWSRWH